MSALTGKGSLSIKKQIVQESAITQVGFTKVRALHSCSAAQTTIILTSLTAPTAEEAPNYATPSPSLLASVDMYAYQNNVEVTSSLRGRLMQNLAYVISGAVTLELRYEAEEGEVLEIIIDHVARTGNSLVDSRPIVVSGTLLAGETDFNVGEPFKVGEFPLAQHGAGFVLIDGQVAYRKVGNDPDGDGDYYEVHAGGGLGTILRFNVDLTNDRNISFMSYGHAERPLGSQLALIEAVQGQIDAMVPTLAALAGVEETDFQAQPNNVDLKAFGDQVFSNTRIINTLLDLEYYTEQVAILQDVRTGDDGSSPSNAYFNRRLNVLRGETPSFVIFPIDGTTGIDGTNTQFSLPAGTYEVTGGSWTFDTGNNNCRLQNLTDAVTQLSGVATANSSNQTGSMLVGRFTIDSTKTFQIQHYTTTAVATFGTGDQNQNSSDEEWFAYLLIRKITKTTFREALGL